MSFGRSCRFPRPRLFGDRRLWLCAVIALTFLVFIPASGQDGPPIGEKASAAATPPSRAAAAKAATESQDMATSAPLKKTANQTKAAVSAKTAASPKDDPAPLTGVAAQCANLLNMAKALKTEVDKTTQDVLSVAVVHDASEIEHMAHKMRESQKH